MSFVQISAWLLVGLLLALSLLHFYWAAGGRLGSEGAVPTVGNEPLFVPGPGACIAVGAALLVAAAVAAARADFLAIGLPDWVLRAGCVSLAIVFAARAIGDFRTVGFFKKVRDTTFGRRDSRIYSPLCALISALAWVVA